VTTGYCDVTSPYALHTSTSTMKSWRILNLNNIHPVTVRLSDVISSYHIYATCFSAILWGKLCKIFLTRATFS